MLPIRSFPLLAPASLCLLAPGALPQQLQPPTSAPQFVERPGSMEFTGRLTVRPLQAGHAERYGLDAEAISARARAAADALAEYELVEYVPATDESIIRVGHGRENEVARALMATGNFQYATPDWLVYPIACPNDPQLGSQWHHDANRMNSCAGWDIATGDPSTVVAICDTGLRTTHVEFQLHRKEGFNAVTNLWESQGGQIDDINGHGTATSGCAAANGNNGLGVSGSGWNLGHRMLRVTNSSGGGAALSDLTQAARVASDQGDRAANVSYSGAGDPSIDTAGAYVRNNGGLLVWAAGNDGIPLVGLRDDNVIYVGATDSADQKSSFSNFGPLVDLMAPGSSIFTTLRSSNSSYGSVSGTSFAAPLTAGLVALIFSADPSLTPQEVEDILRAGCDDLGLPGVDDVFGHGRIDVEGSLLLVTPPGCGSSSYCQTSPNSVGSGSLISGTGSESIAANDFGLAATGNPADKAGIFYMGANQVDLAFGNGRQCASGQITRFPLLFTDGSGNANYAVDNTAPPALGKIVSGSTWNWQFWYRDPMGGGAAFNTSDGLSVTYCP